MAQQPNLVTTFFCQMTITSDVIPGYALGPLLDFSAFPEQSFDRFVVLLYREEQPRLRAPVGLACRKVAPV